jgi:integrase
MNDLIVNNNHLDLVEVAKGLSLSPKTKEAYVYSMRSYMNFCKANETEVGLDSMKAWLDSAKTISTKAAYSAAAKKVLMSVFKGDPRIIETLEAIYELKPGKRDHRITESKYLTVDEVNKLIEVCPIKIGLIVKTLFMTGIRITELLSMKYEKISFIREGQVCEIRVIGKGNKENIVSMRRDLFDEIKEVFEGEIYLFESSNKKPLSRQYVSNSIKKHGRKIGREISAHTLRHTRAHDLVHNKNLSIDKVSKFLNHSSVATTCSFYLHEKPTLEELGII